MDKNINATRICSMETRDKIRSALMNRDPNNLNKIFTNEHKQVLLGSIMGDATLTQNGVNCYFDEIHSMRQYEYLKWKEQYFNIFNGKIVEKKNTDKKTGKNHPAVRLSTSSLPVFTRNRKMFYPDGKKCITIEILNKINELGLTIWYLDDGHVSLPDDIIMISTDAFTYDEHLIMQEWFKERFNVNPEIKKRNETYYIVFNVDDSRKLLGIFKTIFNKYDLPEAMRYKLGTLWEGNAKNIEVAKENLRSRKRKYNNKVKEINRNRKEMKYKPIIKQIRELYWIEGFPMSKIAKQLNYSPTGILKLMKKYNIQRRNRSEANSGEKNGFYGKKHKQESIDMMLKTRWGK